MAKGIFDLVVVGGGAHGGAIVWQYLRKNPKAKIIVFNLSGLNSHGGGPLRGSENLNAPGDTRLNRLANAEENGRQTASVLSTQHYWHEIADDAENLFGKRPHLLQGGGVLIVQSQEQGIRSIHADQDFFGTTVRAGRQHGLRMDEYDDATKFAARFPQFPAWSKMRAVNDYDAGILFSTRCVQEQLKIAQQRGAVIKNQKVLSVEDKAGQVVIKTAGNTYHAAKAFVAPGVSAKNLMPQPHGREFACYPQTIYYFSMSKPQLYTDDAGCPQFVIDYGDGYLYGMPIIAKAREYGIPRAFKVAAEQYTKTIKRPEDIYNYPVSLNQIRRVERLVSRLMNHDGNVATCIGFKTCSYTMAVSDHPLDGTPVVDYGFNIDFSSPNILNINACAGVGFKMSQWIAEQSIIAMEHGALTPALQPYSFARRQPAVTVPTVSKSTEEQPVSGFGELPSSADMPERLARAAQALGVTNG